MKVHVVLVQAEQRTQRALHHGHHDRCGRIDRAYYCPHRSDAGCGCRKPAPGMALQAQADFPDIDFQQAWMVGDSASDIEFGRTLGLRTVLIEGKTEDTARLNALKVDFRFPSLLAFAQWF